MPGFITFITAIIKTLFVQTLTLLPNGTMASSNYVADTSGFKLTGNTGLVEAVSAKFKNCTVSGQIKASFFDVDYSGLTLIAGDNYTIARNMSKTVAAAHIDFNTPNYNLYECYLPFSGTIRVKVYLKCTNAGNYADLRVGNSIVYTFNLTTTVKVYALDVSVSPGDLLAIEPALGGSVYQVFGYGIILSSSVDVGAVWKSILSINSYSSS